MVFLLVSSFPLPCEFQGHSVFQENLFVSTTRTRRSAQKWRWDVEIEALALGCHIIFGRNLHAFLGDATSTDEHEQIWRFVTCDAEIRGLMQLRNS